MVMLKELFDDAMKNIKQPKRGLGIPAQKIGIRGVYLINCPRCKQEPSDPPDIERLLSGKPSRDSRSNRSIGMMPAFAL